LPEQIGKQLRRAAITVRQKQHGHAEAVIFGERPLVALRIGKQQSAWQLGHDTGAIAAASVRRNRAAVRKTGERGQRHA
jgi:hypothetical protein